METLIICTIILLGFVATIMLVCDTRIFILYVATAILADILCMMLLKEKPPA